MKRLDTSARYCLGRPIGAGGFGQVFEARPAHGGRRVALKRAHRGAACGEGAARGSLLHEACCAAVPAHPAFVRVLALDERETAIVMELVRGPPLSVLLRRHAAGLGRPTALDVASQVADAMARAHAAGLVHGDLTPANLLVERAGRVRIVDLGVAHLAWLARPAGPGAGAGTVAYLAPERLLGHPPRPSCDIYALGVVLYEMLTGRRPFPGLSGLALAAAHLQHGSTCWPWPRGSDAASVALVRAMTASDPARRIASMRAVAATIRKTLRS